MLRAISSSKITANSLASDLATVSISAAHLLKQEILSAYNSVVVGYENDEDERRIRLFCDGSLLLTYGFLFRWAIFWKIYFVVVLVLEYYY